MISDGIGTDNKQLTLFSFINYLLALFHHFHIYNGTFGSFPFKYCSISSHFPPKSTKFTQISSQKAPRKMAAFAFRPQMEKEIDWDEIPDDQLEETVVERLEGLKEMFPEAMRSAAASTADWSCWLAKNTFWLASNAAWVLSTSAFIMVLPYFVDKELQDVEKNQLKQQQQLLLGRT